MTKQKTRPWTDYEWIGKTTLKNPIQKTEKTVKIKVKLPHVNKKPLARKRIFVQTPYSHSTLILEQIISRRKTPPFFAPLPVSAWPKSLLQFDFKNHENVWTDHKKNIAGRIPETTRSENPFKRHPTTHQTKRAFTNLWLSWNNVTKRKSKNNKLKSVKI